MTLKALARRGWNVTLLPVDASGIVSPDALRRGHDRRHRARVGDARQQRDRHHPAGRGAGADRARARRAVPHRRGAVGGQDPASTSRARRRPALAVGAQVLRPERGRRAVDPRGTRVAAILTGGKHERSRRAGTENVAGIAGLGAAAQLADEEARHRGARGSAALRDRLEAAVLAPIPGTAINGAREPRVPNTTNISFEGIEAESLLIALDLEGIAVSTGSACSSGTLEPSHVLRAMGLPAHRTQNSIRISLGAANTDAEVDAFLQQAAGGRSRSCATVDRRCDADAYRRRDVGRRRFVGGCGAAGAAGPRRHRSVDAALRPVRRAQTQFGSCCTIDDLHDARRVAARLGIPHYIVNFEEKFNETVVSDFVREYAAGRTPIPCVHCNGDLKFATLVERAAGFDAELVATGPLRARRARRGQRPLPPAAAASTPNKDQSYFLFTLTQAQLAHAIFPVGELDKAGGARARARARSRGRRQARQPRDLLRAERRPRRLPRRSTGSAHSEGDDPRSSRARSSASTPASTASRSASARGSASPPRSRSTSSASTPRPNAVTVGPREALDRRELTASGVNWIAGAPPAAGRTRHRADPPPPPGSRRHDRADRRRPRHAGLRRAAGRHRARPGAGDVPGR